MGNRKLSVIFTVMALTLFSVSQALAQAPIEGWDKAKLGMSPEEVKEVYAEEEQYYKDKYYQKLDYIEKVGSRYSSEQKLELVKMSHREFKEFWKEEKECWSREDGGIGYPYALSCYWFETPTFGNTWVDFEFVEDKLYSIKGIWRGVSINMFVYRSPEEHLETEIEENEQYKHKLAELENALTQKYGHYSEKDEAKSERQYEFLWYEETKTIPVRTEIFVWTDGKGNTITLELRYELFSEEKKR